MKPLIVGIDPGLAATGVAICRGDELAYATTIRGHLSPKALRRASADARSLLSAARAASAPDSGLLRRRRIVSATLITIDAHTPAGAEPPILAIEAFAHRGWLGRRIDTSVEMGALVAELTVVAEQRGHRVVSVDPAISKAGYPSGERDRAKLLPRALRNRHERDAYLAAIAGRRLARAEDHDDG